MFNQTPYVLLVHSESDPYTGAMEFSGRNGYLVDKVTCAEHAEELIAESGKQYYVALISEWVAPALGMPVKPIGPELARKVRSLHKQTVVIFLIDPNQSHEEVTMQSETFCRLPLTFDRERLEEVVEVVIRAAEYHQLDDAASQKRAVESLLETSAALLAGYSEKETQ